MVKPESYTLSENDTKELVQQSSGMSPEIRNIFEQNVGIFAEALLADIGEHLTDDKKELLKTLSQRVIVTDKATLDEYYKNWSSITDEGEVPSDVRGVFFPEGGLILLQDPNEIWDELSENDKNTLYRNFRGNIIGGTEEDKQKGVKNYVLTQILYKNLIHEMVHAVQNQDLLQKKNAPFFECGARYYESHISERFGIQTILEEEDLDTNRIYFYQTLLNHFPDKAHKAFFGNSENASDLEGLVSLFDNTVTQRLFPQGAGL